MSNGPRVIHDVLAATEQAKAKARAARGSRHHCPGFGARRFLGGRRYYDEISDRNSRLTLDKVAHLCYSTYSYL
jgi:hypothetical protein